MEMLIGLLFIAAVLRVLPAAIEDLVVAWRASKTGAWDALDRQHAHRTAQEAVRAERRAALAEKLRRRRERGEVGRPGVTDIVRDVYHGACEDALERRRGKRGDREPTARERRVDEKLDDAIPNRHCPDCGRQLVRDGDGWVHAHGRTCPEKRNPEPGSTGGTGVGSPGTGGSDKPPTGPQQGPPSPARSNGGGQPVSTAQDPQRRRVDGDATEGQTSPDPHSWDSGDANTPRQVTKANLDAFGDYMDVPNDKPIYGPRVYGDSGNREGSTATSKGDPTMTAPTAHEVTTNEAARRAFKSIGDGARKLAEGAALAEQGRMEMAAAAEAVGDGTSSGKFDAQVTAAAAAAVDAAGVVSDQTLNAWNERADAAQGAATDGMTALETYRDSEELVASKNIDPSTLAASQS